jgi:hypothetical protein
LATPGANWRAQVSAIETFFQAPLTSANDTNVTITLGGSPSICLLAATSITMGWTGTLAAGRLNANVVQSVVNDTNVTGSIASQALTLGWTGTLAVGRGGTGAGTFTANGVLYGNTTSALQVTAQGPANSVLTANAGAPSFSAAPTIGTSVTTPLVIGGTAAGSTLTLESTSGAGTSDSIIFATGSQVTAGVIDTNQRFNLGASSNAFDITGAQPKVQVSTTSASSSFDARKYSADSVGATYTALKSRGASVGTLAVLVAGDTLLQVTAAGCDTTPATQASGQILFQADVTPVSGAVPGRITLRTATSGNVMTEFLHGDSTQQTYFPSATTTATAANAFINNANLNQLQRSTSSLRYKTNITPVPPQRIAALTAMEPIEFSSLCEADDPNIRSIGLIAERVAEIDPALVFWGYDDSDFDVFVEEDANGVMAARRVLKEGATLKPDGVMYERVLLLQVAALRAEVAALKERLA